MNGIRAVLITGMIGLLLAGTSGSDPGPAASNKSAEIALLRSQLKSDDRQIRGNAIVALGRLGEAAVPTAPLIVEQFAESMERVTVGTWKSSLAGHAERALQLIGPGVVPALSAGLDHENAEIWGRCALVLGRIGGALDDAVIARLIEMLADADYRVANNASSALKRRGEQAMERLLVVLQEGLKIPPPAKPWKDSEQPDSEDPLTPARQKRNYAVGVLANLNDPRVIEPLLRALDTNDLLLQRWVTNSLRALKSERCQAVFSRDDIVMRLLAFLKTDDRRTRSAISRTLLHVSKEARGTLVTALDDSDRRVRVALFDMWFRIRDDDRVIPAALKRVSATGDDDIALAAPLAIRERLLALRVIGNYVARMSSPDEVLPLVLSRLEDPASSVRNSAAFTLTRIRTDWRADPRIMPALLQALATSPTPAHGRT